MRYYKRIENGFILGVGIGPGGVEITENEFNTIRKISKTAPINPGCYVMLKSDLTWEEFEDNVTEAETEDYENALNKLGVEI